MAWYEKYLGIPWEGKSNPPNTFNCGTLVTWVYQHELGIEMPDSWSNAANLREALADLSMPEAYGFEPYEGARLPFDVCLVQRNVRRDHICLWIPVVGGNMFLHCVCGIGVILESEFEMQATTRTTYMEWRRHKAMTRELAYAPRN